jgi:hypothetical protein
MTPTGNRTYPSKPIAAKSSLLGAIITPEFVLVVIICAIGLLLTFNLMLHLPLSAFVMDV